jgi:hypothetical protein
MDLLIREHDEEVSAGLDPTYDLYRWNIWDTGQNQPDCQRAPENAGRPAEELCNCHRRQKGTWSPGKRRTFDACCQGQLFNAAGWRPLAELQQKFSENDRETWESEYECKLSATKDNILPNLSVEAHGLRSVRLSQADCNVYVGIDFGTRQHTHAVWVAILVRDVEVEGMGGSRVLKAGSRIAVSELYRAECGYNEFSRLYRAHEMKSGLRPVRRWGDAQGTGAIYTLAENGIEVHASNKNQHAQIAHLRDLIDDDAFFVDVDRCPLVMDQLLNWRYAPGTNQPIRGDKAYDHGCDATRYVLFGIRFTDPAAHGEGGGLHAGRPGASQSPYPERRQTATGYAQYQGIPGGYHQAGSAGW